MTAAWPASRSRSIARDQRRRLHRGDQMREEALLGGFEGRARGGLGLRVERAALAGDVGGLQGGVEIVVDDLEGAGIGVVDADLLGRERVLDQLVLDALVGERPGGIEAERLEIAGQHLHGGDAAGLDRLRRTRRAWRRESPRRPRGRAAGHRRDCAPWWRPWPRRRRRARSGSACCRRRPARPCCEGACSPRSPLPPAAFAMAWLSSNTITPSKSDPSQSTICWTRETLSSRASERSVA